MYLVQFLLPLRDNQGASFPRQAFDRIRDDLAARFGGVTAFLRAPAEGVWQEERQVVRDEVVSYEVVTDELDRPWWAGYRHSLEARFRQQEVLVYASPIERL